MREMTQTREERERPRFQTVESVCLFMFAGKATITLRSRRTGARFTYRIAEATKPGSVTHFVGLMTGSDNEKDFAYLGHFFGPDYRHGKKSSIAQSADGAIAFEWFAKMLKANKLPDALEVYHENRCGACGRKLTVPESILTGLGPECSERLGVPRAVCEEVPTGPATEKVVDITPRQAAVLAEGRQNAVAQEGRITSLIRNRRRA